MYGTCVLYRPASWCSARNHATSASIDKLKVDSAAPYKYEYLAALAVNVGSRKRRTNVI